MDEEYIDNSFRNLFLAEETGTLGEQVVKLMYTDHNNNTIELGKIAIDGTDDYDG